MEFLGLHYAIWIVLVLYFAGMLLMGWWSKKGIHNQEGYLLGNRQFGWPMMVMHAFGAGTHPGNVAGVMSQGVVSGASGIWVSWMWLFGTPFYWIIAPIIRRMRCLTMADFFRERFGRSASVLYIIVASVGMVVFLAGVMLATTRTVQGVMGKATVENSDMWFFGILFVTTVVFIIYSYWGGIIAAIRTDMIQGLMIIALSFIAIPIALGRVDGLAGMRATLAAQENTYLSLFDPKQFSLLTVLLLSINAPLTALAFPHLMSVCAAGKTEWEGRIGFTYGNILKRVCTIGWCVLGLCWLAYLLNTGSAINKDAAFGDAIRGLLRPELQGIMLACVMAAAMSSGDAVQVTVAGLFSQNIYRVFINPKADEKRLVHVTRIIGVFIAFSALVAAILMRSNLVKAILDYFNILSLVGISTAMGILWRRMNSTGMFCSTILAVTVFLLTRHFISWSEAELVQQGLLVVTDGVRTWAVDVGVLRSLTEAGFLGWTKTDDGMKLAFTRLTTIAAPLLVGIVSGVLGSLLTKPPKPDMIEKFFKKIYTPIGKEERLDLPLDEAVPKHKRLFTGGGLFIMKPSRQSWIGFVITLGICLACVLVMLAILK
ncbi:MAG: sodium:solute symporter family protein [Planctomycetes bacterium]|nr:sodium:solute symporter family protein [Planctomycetota bacterium]